MKTNLKKQALLMDFKIKELDFSTIHSGKNVPMSEAINTLETILNKKLGFKINARKR